LVRGRPPQTRNNAKEILARGPKGPLGKFCDSSDEAFAVPIVLTVRDGDQRLAGRLGGVLRVSG